MKSWPPSLPEADTFVPVLMRMKEDVRQEVRSRKSSAEDRRISQYMRDTNVGTRLISDAEGPYKGQLVVSFDTVTDRKIRRDRLRLFQVSPDGKDIFAIRTAIAHAVANNLTKKEAAVLAREMVGGFYDQYEFALMAGASAKELREISPHRYGEQLREIYESIRQRSLAVLENE